MTAPLILASTSETRRRMLASAGVSFVSEPARVDEDALREALAAEGASPRDQADVLAEAKARKVAERHPEALVIGSDQILDFGGSVFSKPRDAGDLRDQLARLSDGTHRLLSAAVVYEGAKPVWRHVGEARLTMHPLSPDFIGEYVERHWDTVRTSVGGYRIEAEGIRLFSRIEGSYHAVLGLPLVELLSYLRLRKVLDT